MIAVPIFIICLLIGGYNLVFTEHISKRAFFCVWFALLLYVIAYSIK